MSGDVERSYEIETKKNLKFISKASFILLVVTIVTYIWLIIIVPVQKPLQGIALEYHNPLFLVEQLLFYAFILALGARLLAGQYDTMTAIFQEVFQATQPSVSDPQIHLHKAQRALTTFMYRSKWLVLIGVPVGIALMADIVSGSLR